MYHCLIGLYIWSGPITNCYLSYYKKVVKNTFFIAEIHSNRVWCRRRENKASSSIPSCAWWEKKNQRENWSCWNPLYFYQCKLFCCILHKLFASSTSESQRYCCLWYWWSQSIKFHYQLNTFFYLFKLINNKN